MDELPKKPNPSYRGVNAACLLAVKAWHLVCSGNHLKKILLHALEKLKGKSLTLKSLKLKVLSLKAQPKKFKDGKQPRVAPR